MVRWLTNCECDPFLDFSLSPWCVSLTLGRCRPCGMYSSFPVHKATGNTDYNYISLTLILHTKSLSFALETVAAWLTKALISRSVINSTQVSPYTLYFFLPSLSKLHFLKWLWVNQKSLLFLWHFTSFASSKGHDTAAQHHNLAFILGTCQTSHFIQAMLVLAS